MSDMLTQTSDETETDAGMAPGPKTPSQRIAEVVVCSSQGEVLYAWQCEDMEERLKLLECLRSKAKTFSKILVLGEVDRWVLDGPGCRIVTRFEPDWSVWVRVAQPECDGPR